TENAKVPLQPSRQSSRQSSRNRVPLSWALKKREKKKREKTLTSWLVDKEKGVSGRNALEQELRKTRKISQVHKNLEKDHDIPCSYKTLLKYINNDDELSEIYHSCSFPVASWLAHKKKGALRLHALKEELRKTVKITQEVLKNLKEDHDLSCSYDQLRYYINNDPELSKIYHPFTVSVASVSVASWLAHKKKGALRLHALKEELRKTGRISRVLKNLEKDHDLSCSYQQLRRYINNDDKLSEIYHSCSIPVTSWLADEKSDDSRLHALKEELGKTGNITQVYDYLKEDHDLSCSYGQLRYYINNNDELSEIYHSYSGPVAAWLADEKLGDTRRDALNKVIQDSYTVQDAWDELVFSDVLSDAPFLSVIALTTYLLQNPDNCSEDLKADCFRVSHADSDWRSNKKEVAESCYPNEYKYHQKSYPVPPECKGLQVTGCEKDLEVHGMDGNEIETKEYMVSGVEKSPNGSMMIMTGETSMCLHGSGGKFTSVSPGKYKQEGGVSLSLVLNLGSQKDSRGKDATSFIAAAEKNNVITNSTLVELIDSADVFNAARTSKEHKTLSLDLIPSGGRSDNGYAKGRYKGESKKDKAMTKIINLADSHNLVITRALILRYRYGSGTIHSDGVYRSINTFGKVIFKYGGGNFMLQEEKDGHFCVVSLETPPVITQASDLGQTPPLVLDDNKGDSEEEEDDYSTFDEEEEGMDWEDMEKEGGERKLGDNQAPASVDPDFTKRMGGLGVSPRSALAAAAGAAAAAAGAAAAAPHKGSYRDINPGSLFFSEEDWDFTAEVAAAIMDLPESTSPESTKSTSGMSPSHKKGRMFSPKTTDGMMQQGGEGGAEGGKGGGKTFTF
ncbi:hypothetical protein TrRE_jg1510, partial [Triparma retinervis]